MRGRGAQRRGEERPRHSRASGGAGEGRGGAGAAGKGPARRCLPCRNHRPRCGGRRLKAAFVPRGPAPSRSRLDQKSLLILPTHGKHPASPSLLALRFSPRKTSPPLSALRGKRLTPGIPAARSRQISSAIAMGRDERGGRGPAFLPPSSRALARNRAWQPVKIDKSSCCRAINSGLTRGPARKEKGERARGGAGRLGARAGRLRRLRPAWARGAATAPCLGQVLGVRNLRAALWSPS